ncbi:MAG TPA: hypothetical protein VMB51_13725 [Solirubrobacteraceae bacterium]|nr:hypothetical protein [Solirubrobacteraceae bacterium]
MEGNEGTIMGDGIQINRLGERSSSHTQMHSRPRPQRSSADTRALREKLIAALVAVVAEGGDPRLI